MSRPPLPPRTQLRLDLAQKASEAPLAADPAAVIRTLADLMLQVLHPVAGNPVGGGDEPENHR